ncbi:MAG: FecR domain-containing protein [Deltaproteobacteria bacterium]|nr:FecR domain-containing protein [Deltaproteobacteria bacterium]
MQNWGVVLAALLCLNAACDKKAPEQKGNLPKSVALLKKMVGEVSHRPAGTLRWNDARAGLPLQTRDAIKTGKGASATVTFAGGSKLEVDAQTLIIIELPQGDRANAVVAVARVEKGTVRGVVHPGVKPLEIVSKSGKRTRISATTRPVTFRVRAVEGEKLQVAALKGVAKVQVGDETVDLEANQAVEIGTKNLGHRAPLPPFPVLQSPAVDENLSGQDVKLSWQAAQRTLRYRVQLARSLDFSDLILDNQTEAASWTIARLAAGHYIWRVSSFDARGWEGEFGFARRFVIARPDPKPTASQPSSQLIAPAPNAMVVTTAKRMSVNFRWKPVEGATSYLLVVARRSNLRRRVARIKVKKGTSYLLRLRWGTFYWGVYAIDDAGKKSPLFVEPNKLKIGRRRPPHVGVPRTINRWR